MGWDILIGNIRKTLDLYYPMVEYKNVPAKATWITSELFELMFQRDEKFKEAKLTKNPDVWDEAKKLRNQVATDCKNAKRAFIKGNITRNQNNPKKFWSEIGQIWNNNKSESNHNINLKNPINGKMTDGASVGEVFNQYFSRVGQNLQKAITPLSSHEDNMLKQQMIPKHVCCNNIF